MGRRHTWTVNALQMELGFSSVLLRRLIETQALIPEGWENINKSDRMARLASMEFVIFDSDIKQLIQSSINDFLGKMELTEKLDDLLQLNYEMFAEIRAVRKDFDLSMEPMTLREIAAELSNISIYTLYNYIIKTGNGQGVLVYPKKKPWLNLPIRKLKGSWEAERFEFLRQKRGLNYDQRRKLHHDLVSNQQ